MKEAKDKILEEPIWDEFDERTQRIRKNLLILASVLLIINCFDLGISSGAISGLQITGLTKENTRIIIAIIVIYNLIHFAVVVWNYYLRWGVRITASRHAIMLENHMKWKSVDATKHSNLYTWWLRTKKDFEGIPSLAKQIEELAERFDPKHNFANFDHQVERLEKEFQKTQKLICDDRVVRSLKEFDNWYSLFQKAQGIRWILIEVWLPLYLGMLSLILLKI